MQNHLGAAIIEASAASDVSRVLPDWAKRSDQVLIVSDDKGRAVFANEAACRWRECSHKALLALSLSSIDPQLAGAWADTADPRWYSVSPSSWDIWLEDADGRRTAITTRVQAIERAGCRHLVLTSGDFAPRRDVERELKCTLTFVWAGTGTSCRSPRFPHCCSARTRCSTAQSTTAATESRSADTPGPSWRRQERCVHFRDGSTPAQSH